MDSVVRMLEGRPGGFLLVGFGLIYMFLAFTGCILLITDEKHIKNRKWINIVVGVLSFFSIAYIPSLVGMFYNKSRFRVIFWLSTFFFLATLSVFGLRYISTKYYHSDFNLEEYRKTKSNTP